MREQSVREFSETGRSSEETETGGPAASSCALWDGCAAPLCPLSPLVGGWYSDEPVCRSRKHGAGVRWVSVQRRIARLPQVEGYFTVEDLERVCKVRRGIRGRNPDAPTDHCRNGHPRGREPSRDGVLRACDPSVESETLARSGQAGNTAQASSAVPTKDSA